jgi:hypothetical protein
MKNVFVRGKNKFIICEPGFWKLFFQTIIKNLGDEEKRISFIRRKSFNKKKNSRDRKSK